MLAAEDVQLGRNSCAEFVDVTHHADDTPAGPQVIQDPHDEVERLGIEGAETLIDEDGVEHPPARLRGDDVGECEDVKLVPVQPAPGLLVPGKGEPPKVRADVHDLLEQAGEVAKQRGTSIEVLAGAETVADAVKRWNIAALDAALAAAKAAPAGDRKEKSQMGAAKKRLDPEANPRSWGAEACKTGRLAGFGVEVQLVALDASGGRGKVLVKGGPEADHFERESYEATYRDKAKGKSFRQLTEIMSAGKFVRECSVASRFTAMPELDGTWRCREEGESWEPSNRPLPPWQ